MSKKLNLVGERYGRLTVLREEKKQGARNYWICQCDCGNTSIVATGQLRSGKTKSCGCLRSEINRARHLGHGMTYSRIYTIWAQMRGRCNNPNDSKYYRYGGRGITVCDEWSKFEAFFEWAMNNGYSDNLSIDRKNNDGNYEPDNCRWTTNMVQSNNRSTNVYYTVDGITDTLANLARRYGVCYKTVHTRISSLGWDVKRALTKPPK